MIENLLARLDHAAIDRTGDHRRHLVRSHRDHRLVEHRHSLHDPSLGDQGASLDVAGERYQVDLTEPPAELGGLTRDRVSAGPVSLDRAQQRRRDQHIPELRAVAPAIVEQPARPGEPATAAGELPAIHQDEHQPARAPYGTQRLTGLQQLAMRTLPQLDALLVATGQVRRRGKPHEIIRRDRRLSIRRRQLGERTGPSTPTEQLPATTESIRRRCAVSSDGSSGTSASRGAPGRASVPARHDLILRPVDRAHCRNHSLPQSTPHSRMARPACTLSLPAGLRASQRSTIRRSPLDYPRARRSVVH